MLVKTNILVVEDEQAVRENLTELLEISGYKVVAAEDGLQALAILKAYEPDLIISDVMMPRMDGFRLCQYIRQQESKQDTPIILLTARNDHDSVIQGFKHGANDYITKPFKRQELLARVGTHASLKQKTSKLQEYTRQLEIQKKLIEQKNEDLTDSLNYAQKLQEATLPDMNRLKQFFPESFVFAKARDIVSGDFYWFHLSEDYQLIVLGDCTGHGVPGALLTMLGVSLLHDLVEHRQITDPKTLLETLDHDLGSLIANSANSSQSYDGIDIGFVLIKKNNRQLLFAGAKRPLYLIRNHKLHEYKGGKSYIGSMSLYARPKHFEQISIDYQAGDMIYLVSDGLVSQFGGAKAKKYNQKRQRDLFTAIAHRSIDQQIRYVNQVFTNWKGNQPQVDDILMLALRL